MKELKTNKESNIYEKNIFDVYNFVACFKRSSPCRESSSVKCDEGPKTKLEWIQKIAGSEAVRILAGPRADISSIEVISVSESGEIAFANISFSGSAGNTNPKKVRAQVSCKVENEIELE